MHKERERGGMGADQYRHSNFVGYIWLGWRWDRDSLLGLNTITDMESLVVYKHRGTGSRDQKEM